MSPQNFHVKGDHPGIFDEYGKETGEEEKSLRGRINETGDDFFCFSSRPSRGSYSRKLPRVSIREPGMCLVYRPPVSCCTHTSRFIASTLHTYSRIAVQSNLELSLSNTSRVLGRCLRSGFTIFLRRTTADITGGKRRTALSRRTSRGANRKYTCPRNSPPTLATRGLNPCAVDYILKLYSFRCLLTTGLPMRPRSGRKERLRKPWRLIRVTKWSASRNFRETF